MRDKNLTFCANCKLLYLQIYGNYISTDPGILDLGEDKIKIAVLHFVFLKPTVLFSVTPPTKTSF